jgi:hypothetical protein
LIVLAIATAVAKSPTKMRFRVEKRETEEGKFNSKFRKYQRRKKMTRVLTTNAKNITPKGQPSRMTCWLTAYEMLFNSGGEFCTQADIEKRLKDGGFNVEYAKSSGIGEDDFSIMARILKTGTLLPGQLLTIGALAVKLTNYGVLWVALQIPKDIYKPNGERYPHIIIVCGVDVERDQVAIINPWKENPADIPCLAWVDWSWFRKSIQYTQSVDAGCQYYQRGGSRTDGER